MSNTINNANEVQVINNNGELVVSSRKVAEDFGKEHRNVLANIREMLTAENSAVLNEIRTAENTAVLSKMMKIKPIP